MNSRPKPKVSKDRQDFYDYEWRISAATCKLNKAIKFFHFTLFLLLQFILDIVLVNFLSQFFFGFCFNSLSSFAFLVFMLGFAFYCPAFCCKSEKRKRISVLLFTFLSVSCSFISLSVVCCSFFFVFGEKSQKNTLKGFFSSLKNYPDREENGQRGMKKNMLNQFQSRLSTVNIFIFESAPIKRFVFFFCFEFKTCFLACRLALTN